MFRQIVLGIVLVATSVVFVGSAEAQFPNWRAVPVRPNIDVIPPLGNLLPRSYAARYNRPSYITGRIAYTIEPTSQEAMAWQRAWQRGDYARHAPPTRECYMYPKPWEVLVIGPRPETQNDDDDFGSQFDDDQEFADPDVGIEMIGPGLL